MWKKSCRPALAHSGLGLPGLLLLRGWKNARGNHPLRSPLHARTALHRTSCSSIFPAATLVLVLKNNSTCQRDSGVDWKECCYLVLPVKMRRGSCVVRSSSWQAVVFVLFFSRGFTQSLFAFSLIGIFILYNSPS